ncbi:single-stranded DNA-binding protein [Nocardiopsis prasina]|uniref:single-stranded DNA-binding protein n=1 Tax=Nocardiopsis prasina TaxID=2015 RepID=UPI00034A7458
MLESTPAPVSSKSTHATIPPGHSTRTAPGPVMPEPSGTTSASGSPNGTEPPPLSPDLAVSDVTAPERPDRAEGHRNEVLVVGRVTAAPSERELPSGDRLVTWRICVARPEVPGRKRARADSMTLVSFDPHLCARVEGWRVGDVVRVTGELRRRTWRGWNGIHSVLEVEADTASRVREAGR